MSGDLITQQLLIEATGCSEISASLFSSPLNRAARSWEIDTPPRVAMWVAQMAHESALFTRTEEDLSYSAPRLLAVWPGRFGLPTSDAERDADVLASGRRNALAYSRSPQKLAEFVYGGRLGNRPEGSGDGWKYRGRGLPQLTGRWNYLRYGAAAGVDALGNPDQIAFDTVLAADAAGWFWWSIEGNSYADSGDVAGLTRAINGGMTGFDERAALTARSLSAFVAA